MPNQERDGSVIKALQRCGEGLAMARIAYQKPGDKWATDRLVEPYQFTYSCASIIVHTWQVDPALDSEPCWRNFRIDRITRVEPSAKTFAPRQPVTLHTGEMKPFKMDDGIEIVFTAGSPPASKPTPQQLYAEALNAALADLTLTAEETIVLKSLGAALSESQIRALHGRYYADLLADVCADGRITKPEMEKLTAARVWLGELGWSP